MNGENLVELVNAYDAYCKENPEAIDLGSFCLHYLNKQLIAQEGWENIPSHDGMLGYLFGRLTRYSTVYARKALSELELGSLEEFGYLGSLTEVASMKKSELIQAHLSEFTSGIEVIKRLINKGFIEEFPDPDDKRSRRVRLTEAGSKVFFDSIPRMEKVGKIMFTPFTPKEKQSLFELFHRAVEVHDRTYPPLRNKSLEEIEQGMPG